MRHKMQIVYHWKDALKHPVYFIRWMISWQGCSDENVSFNWFRTNTTEGMDNK